MEAVYDRYTYAFGHALMAKLDREIVADIARHELAVARAAERNRRGLLFAKAKMRQYFWWDEELMQSQGGAIDYRPHG